MKDVIYLSSLALGIITIKVLIKRNRMLRQETKSLKSSNMSLKIENELLKGEQHDQ